MWLSVSHKTGVGVLLLFCLGTTALHNGCFKEDKIDYYGNDIKGEIVVGVDACANLCGETAACEFWSFVKSDKTCWIKTSNSDKRGNFDRVSGTRSCATVIEHPKYLKVSFTGRAAVAQKDRMGIYTLQDEYRNKFPVWKKEGAEQYLFVANNQFWRIGSDLDSNMAGIYNTRWGSTPSSPLIAGGWKYWDGRWNKDKKIKVEVVPDMSDIIWSRGKNIDCWKGCGKKGGPCSSTCGPSGFCCRKGYNDCPLGAQLISPNYHSCINSGSGKYLPSSGRKSGNVDTLPRLKAGRLLEAMKKVHGSPDWDRVASIHGEPVRQECGEKYCCVHNGHGGFLPWHRLLLETMDDIIQKHEYDAVIPYWDWTIYEFPTIAENPHIYNPLSNYSMKNPFYKGLKAYDHPGTFTVRNVSVTSTSKNLRDVLAALQENDFLLFSLQLQHVHNRIHDYVGGDMGGLATAGYDPIFYLHHSMVDLVWAVYQVLKPRSLPPPVVLQQQMIPFGRTGNYTLKSRRYKLDINSPAIIFGNMNLTQISQLVFPEFHLTETVKLYAGFFMKSLYTSGRINFNICNQDDCSYPGGEVAVFGGEKERPHINSDPVKVDVTDVVKNAGIEYDNVTFVIHSFETLEGKTSNGASIYQPVRVLMSRTGKVDYHIFFKHRNQPPTIRIPSNTTFEIESSYQEIYGTKIKSNYENCNPAGSRNFSSGEQIDIKTKGGYYFFDDNCEKKSCLTRDLMGYPSCNSKIKIIMPSLPTHALLERGAAAKEPNVRGSAVTKRNLGIQISNSQWHLIINKAISDIFTAAGEPELGSWINLIINLFWPSPDQPNIFETIRAQVEELVDIKIFKFEQNLLLGEINGIEMDLQMYRDAKLHEKGAYLENVLSKCNGVFSKIKISDHRHQLVPIMVTLGMVHLITLKERTKFGKQIYQEDNQEVWDRELQSFVELYENTLKQLYLEWKTWRNDKIETISRPARTLIFDSAYGTVMDTLTNRQVHWEEYGNVHDIFAPDVILQKQSWFSVSNSKYFSMYSKSFNFNKFLPNREDNPPKIPAEFEILEVGPFYWSRLKNPQKWDNPGGKLAAILIREYNSIDALQMKYTNHSGNFIGNPWGGEEHIHNLSNETRLSTIGMGFNNRGLVELILTDFDGKEERIHKYGNRGQWELERTSFVIPYFEGYTINRVAYYGSPFYNNEPYMPYIEALHFQLRAFN